MSDLTLYPKQRLSFAEKTKDDYKWAKDVMDNLLLQYSSGSASNAVADEYSRKLANYQLYNNILNQQDFERECNPLGIQVGQFKDTIQPYNKTYNKIQVLLGEELKRPFNYRTVLVNSDGIKSKQLAKQQFLRDFIMYELEKTMSQFSKGEFEMEELNNLIEPSELESYMSTTYLHAKEHVANQILQYLTKKLSIPELKNDAFKHGLIAGEEFIWVGIENGEPVVQVLNPLGVIYHKSPEVKYIDSGLYAGYRTYMNPGDILDKLGDFLEEKQISRLEGTLRGVNGIRDDIISKQMKYHTDDVYDHYLSHYFSNGWEEGSYGKAASSDWLVSHIEWKSQKRVGFINYINEFGDPQTDMVSEDFIVPPYAETKTTKTEWGKKKTYYAFDGKLLEWSWIPEVWQGIRVGDDMHCAIGPKKYQYRSVDNPKDVRLGYHGLVYNNMNAEAVSLMDRMKPFQYLYFIIVHKLKKLIARDKGKLFHFDVTMVPEELGLAKTLYYLDEMDIDFYNPLMNAEQPGAMQRGKVKEATDRSNMQHILNYVNLMHAIDEQIGDVAGITRQREGQISANEAVTNSQQNILQSSTITEAVYFYPHEKLWERVLNSLIQCTQVLWAGKSVVKQYVLDDLSVHTLKVTPDSLRNADFGIFVSKSAKDNEIFETLKQLAQPLLQNDKAKMSDIIKLIKAESVQELEKTILKSEKVLQQEQVEQIQAAQESQKAATEAQMQIRQAEFEHERLLQQQKDEAAYSRELLKAQVAGQEVDPTKLAKLELDARKLDTTTRLEEEKIMQAAKQKELDRQSAERIAKLRKPTPKSS